LLQTGSSDNRSSEWLGAGGGNHRTGAGLASDLALAGPIAAFRNSVVYYPSPLTGNEATLRFFSPTNRTARLVVFNLEGEEILRSSIPVVGGQINEHQFNLADISSGLYICQLTHETDDGLETTTTTLAVER